MFTKLKTKHTDCNYCSYMGCVNLIGRHGAIGHWVWVFQWYSRKLSPVKAYRRVIRRLTALNYSRIKDIEVDGIDTRDYPDFCDAFIASATYKGRPMTDSELDRLNDDREFVDQCVYNRLY